MMASVSRPARMFWMTWCWPGRQTRTPKVRSARASAGCFPFFTPGMGANRTGVAPPDSRAQLDHLELSSVARRYGAAVRRDSPVAHFALVDLLRAAIRRRQVDAAGLRALRGLALEHAAQNAEPRWREAHHLLVEPARRQADF